MFAANPTPFPHVQTINLPVLSAGIDWITTTTRDEHRRTFVGMLARKWLSAAAADGHEIKDLSWNGYIGQRTEGVSFGDRGDGTLVRLSGEQARLHADVLAARVDHVSRLDFQVTLRDENENRDWAEVAANLLAQDERISSGQTSTVLVTGNKTGSTLYIGRRVSDRFFRLYNKHAESKGAWPEGTWRWEVEYKGRRAETWSSRIANCAWSPDDSRAVVVAAFGDYGLDVPAGRIPSRWADKSPRKQTDDESRLKYLGVTIRPMVAKLKEAYGTGVLRTVLDLDEAQEEKENG